MLPKIRLIEEKVSLPTLFTTQKTYLDEKYEQELQKELEFIVGENLTNTLASKLQHGM